MTCVVCGGTGRYGDGECPACVWRRWCEAEAPSGVRERPIDTVAELRESIADVVELADRYRNERDRFRAFVEALLRVVDGNVSERHARAIVLAARRELEGQS